MRLAFVVNDVATEIDEYTTTRLARAALRTWPRGLVRRRRGTSSSAESDGPARGNGPRRATFEPRTTRSRPSWSASRGATPKRIDLDDLDALFLRNESIDDLQERPWASPLACGLRADAEGYPGVTVVNDPMSLVRATSKLYLEEFPEKIRPRRRLATRRRSRGSFATWATASSSRCTGPRVATCS